MKHLLKEPLVHFLVLGSLLFCGYVLLNRNAEPAPNQIVISQGQLASMVENFTLTRKRLPTREEMEGLIRAQVRGEVYYREALALGLDKDDAIIRRRLQQKMEFISDDIAAQAQPTDDELKAFLQGHPDKFRAERRFTFRQVYLNPEKHGTTLAIDASQLLSQLIQTKAGADVAAVGDSFLLEHDFFAVPVSEIVRQFGKEFASKLGTLPDGQWQGPVESAFGVHLVFINERLEERLPAMEEVHEAVRREWDIVRRLEANEKFYQELLKRYVVNIEQPPPEAEKRKLAAAK